MNRFEMRERLENKLTKKRFEHSLGVEYVSGCLAMVHGADVNKALTAGLLHDCAKCLPADEKIARCKKHGLPISQVEFANPELLHAHPIGYRIPYNWKTGYVASGKDCFCG